ncbi:acetolactate synthase large subunit [Orrella sp. JC864]|uniref:acetolactate synthase large subunit n=1 Tax=Orrella sp. JC864 TaxID=3120298 RepID=UPI003008E2F9
MNGADHLCATLLANGVDTCFANPGTSEMHFVAALDRETRMRCVLGLFEGVVTGAADGYARMADKPAATLLHLGPGLANGLANLHNARRAFTPMVNVVGEHASYHLQYDAPLTSDIESLARPMSHWVKRSGGAASVGADAAEAVRAARQGQGRIATLILPADAAWGELPADTAAVVAAAPDAPAPISPESVRAAAQALRSGQPAMMMLGGLALRERPLAVAGRIARATGVKLVTETSNRRAERGATRTPVDRFPYPLGAALEKIQGIKQLVLVGARDPVAFFAYPGKPSLLAPADCARTLLAHPDQDLTQALEWLADELGIAPDAPGLQAPAPQTELPVQGRLDSAAVGRLLAARLPEHAIVCDESITQGREFPALSQASAPHDYLQLTGGSIGIGLPLATGAAVACPGRKVIALQADGSAMYTAQALWTQARENLDCLTIILANRSYAILHGEMKSMGVTELGRNARRMLDLDEPALDWVHLARGMGVEAVRTDTVQAFAQALAAGLARQGPFLIEAVI